jgi:hypothetical protein
VSYSRYVNQIAKRDAERPMEITEKNAQEILIKSGKDEIKNICKKAS